jgi:4-amino-4-deoxy-L-arabinose transferase-like glycosyltransferase
VAPDRWFPGRAATATGERRWRAALVVIALVALATRVGIIVVTPDFAPSGDPADYQRHAVSIAAGLGYPSTEIATPGTPSAFRPPAYPYLLGGLYAVVGVHLNAGRLLGAILGALAVVLLAYLGRAVWNRRIGLLAGALTAIYLPLIALNATLLSESLFLPVELGVALCLVPCSRRPEQLRWPILAGALCAVAALTRAVADAWLLPVVAVVVLAAPAARRRWRSMIAALVAFVVVLSPWTVRNLTTFHAFVPISTEDGYTLAGQYNAEAGRDDAFEAVWRLPGEVPSLQRTLLALYRRPGGVDEVQLDAALRSAGVRYLKQHPSHLAVATGLDTLRMFDLGKGHSFTTGVSYRELNLPSWLRTPTTLSAQLAALLSLAALLAWLIRRSSVKLGPWWLWAIPVLTIALTVPTVGNPRKRAPLDPFMLLLSAVTIDWVLAQVRTRRSRS